MITTIFNNCLERTPETLDSAGNLTLVQVRHSLAWSQRNPEHCWPKKLEQPLPCGPELSLSGKYMADHWQLCPSRVPPHSHLPIILLSACLTSVKDVSGHHIAIAADIKESSKAVS